MMDVQTESYHLLPTLFWLTPIRMEFVTGKTDVEQMLRSITNLMIMMDVQMKYFQTVNTFQELQMLIKMDSLTVKTRVLPLLKLGINTKIMTDVLTSIQ